MRWFISSYPRCGTHMLVTALDSHPELQCHGEIFNPRTQPGSHGLRKTAGVLEKFWQPGCGFAAHAYIGRRPKQITETAPRGVFQDFWSHIPPGTRVISLRRRNHLRRYVSHCQAKLRKVWNSETKPVGSTSCVISHKKLLASVAFAETCWKQCLQQFPDALVVYYEDLCDNWGSVTQELQQYLEVAPHALRPSTQKLGGELRDTIANFDELTKQLKRSGHQHWID